MQKERKKIDKQLFHLQAERFACASDAIKALEKFTAKYHNIVVNDVISHPMYQKRGRPKIGDKPSSFQYQVMGSVSEIGDKLIQETLRRACFVLGTNQLDFNASQVIDGYKMQTQVELGFRFLKSPIFYAQPFYLKKPERIEALLMIMTLSLLVYSIAQRRIRTVLAEKEPVIADSSKKLTTRPTLNRVFQVFQGINMILTGTHKKIYTGLKNVHLVILEALGCMASRMYGHHFAKT